MSAYKALVVKNLTRKEIQSDPKAIEAIQKEGRALVEAETWLEDTAYWMETCARLCRRSTFTSKYIFLRTGVVAITNVAIQSH